ncbi:hypothetical protein [Falsibacillus albus]|uniref:Lipoprotein n=1 Tax=Falsibacillus albus TaxID=2478915 RepID=A0A3L7JPL5_9BACI|nr:hypothetical protein [Falsibacillus albus]RLQ92420.1 hypothetical protein D9X91_19435 [Falsibacillus albus]
MKAILKFVLFLFMMTVMAGCSSKDIMEKTDIDYSIYFQGFIVNKDSNAPPAKLIIFTNKEDWETFSKEYVEQGQRVASMDHSIDWKQEDLIYYAMNGAKDGYVGNFGTFKGYEVNQKRIEVKIEGRSHSKQIFAVNNLNDDYVSITYQLWTLVKKGSLSKKLTAQYHY